MTRPVACPCGADIAISTKLYPLTMLGENINEKGEVARAGGDQPAQAAEEPASMWQINLKVL